jgi:DNA-binding MarR family transcriptional regulator
MVSVGNKFNFITFMNWYSIISYMETNITDESSDLVAFGKGLEILLSIYNEGPISHQKLANEIDISSSYLSKQIAPLAKHSIIRTELGVSTWGRPPNIYVLESKTRNTITKLIEEFHDTSEKETLKDLDSFFGIVSNLMDSKVRKYAADILQITSKKYKIPVDSYYFQFLAKNLTNPDLEPSLRVILNSTRSFCMEFNDSEKLQVYSSIGSNLEEILASSYPKSIQNGIHNEAQALLDELSVSDLPFNVLKTKYLKAIEDQDGSPKLYREILLDQHYEHIHMVQLEVFKLLKSEHQIVCSRAETELELLR